MKTSLLILAVFLSSGVFAQNFFTETKENQIELKHNKKVQPGEKIYTVDVAAMTQFLANAPQRENYVINSTLSMEFPDLNGKMERFYMAEASNFAPALQAAYPQIRAYRGVSAENPGVTISLSVSPRGIQTMRLAHNAPSLFIESISVDNRIYKVFTKSEKSPDWACSTPEEHMENDLTDRFGNQELLAADDQTMRDFRLALSCTGEYTNFFGGTVEGALGAMNATMSRVNPVFERDVALRLTIIENNADVIYTNANTDPYAPASNMQLWNNQLQNTLTNVIGEANYDIGHLFGRTGGGGNAGCIGCVCVNGQKGSGYTSPSNGIPEGDSFDIDYVIHEFGHQLGANHTFIRFEGSGVNYEPGSGSTIMGYAGITYPNTNVQMHSDDYFHYGSVIQITNNIKNKTCPTTTSLANNPPVADAGPDYTIPIGTAFVLTGSGSDPDEDDITFTWEQINSASFSSNDFTIVNPNSTTGPLFRSLPPSTNPVRYFPSYEKVLEGSLSYPFESVSNVSRNTNFALTVRDNNPNGGQTKTDQMRVGVTATGGVFYITAPDNNSSAASGSDYTVTWNVAQTNQSPVNTSHVDILFSTDGGATFTVLAANTPNDGEQIVSIPANSTSQDARIMIRAVNNIFYAVSKKFYIDYNVTIECRDFSASNLPLAIPDGTANGYGAYAIASIPVPNIGAVDEITVDVDISHTYIGDLQVVLQSPSPAQMILLWNRQCGSTDNINATFSDSGSAVNCSTSPVSGTILPNNPLSAFRGFNSQGNWLIGARDGSRMDTGTINAASMTFCSTTLTPMGTADVVQQKSQIDVYPNPSNGLFNITTELAGKGVQLSVYDVSGKLLHTFSDQNATGMFRHELNLSHVAKGVYVLQVQSGTKMTSKKLIVK
ncbi:MAG: zinc-dependent metalloprotease family protein [Flavobacteriaceae bacterium]|nr:zinc-dependent metalloprotease family protein [Flavobacteriaceae bacterium]